MDDNTIELINLLPADREEIREKMKASKNLKNYSEAWLQKKMCDLLKDGFIKVAKVIKKPVMVRQMKKHNVLAPTKKFNQLIKNNETKNN